jgi:hypothetical protein
MNGDSIFYNLFGSGVSCLRIKRLRDLEIEFLICEILSTLCEYTERSDSLTSPLEAG